jgi:hypothetical protein
MEWMIKGPQRAILRIVRTLLAGWQRHRTTPSRFVTDEA